MGATVEIIVLIDPPSPYLDKESTDDKPFESAQLDSILKNWPPDFFEKTTGCLADDPIERAHQGEYEIREVLK